MSIQLNERQLSLISNIVASSGKCDLKVLDCLTNNLIAPNERQLILGLVEEELTAKGFGPDSEPTSYGLELEALIDVLNRPNIKS